MRKDTQTHTHLTRARDRDAETPYKNSSTDLASDTRDLYVLGRLEPQSLQSVPRAQMLYSLPEPPSSHSPSCA